MAINHNNQQNRNIGSDLIQSHGNQNQSSSNYQNGALKINMGRNMTQANDNKSLSSEQTAKNNAAQTDNTQGETTNTKAKHSSNGLLPFKIICVSGCALIIFVLGAGLFNFVNNRTDDMTSAADTLPFIDESDNSDLIKSNADITETSNNEDMHSNVLKAPDLIGMNKEDAIAVCESLGISYTIYTMSNDSVEKDTVFSQTIPADSDILIGTSIGFWVSDGKISDTVSTNNKTTNEKSTDVTSKASITIETDKPYVNTASTSNKSNSNKETAATETTKLTTAKQDTAIKNSTNTKNRTWNETELHEMIYLDQDCYSRYEPFPGTEAVKKYNAGTEIEIVAATDTSYYKLADGTFIHSDYCVDDDLDQQRTISEDDTSEITIRDNTYSINEEELYLYAGTTAEDIIDLDKMVNLKKLIIEPYDGGCLVEDYDGERISDLKSLRGLTDLEFLEVIWTKITSVSELSELVNLQHLELQSNCITDISGLSNMDQLTYLDIFDNKITDISPLSNLTNLEHLDISNNLITDISPIANLTNLEELHVGNYEATLGAGLATNSKNKISDISCLAELNNLTYLSLYGTSVRDISPLSNSFALERLLLDDNQIDDISYISKLKNLKYLSLNNNNISDISSLKNLSELEWLYLESNPIQDYSVIKNLTSLTSLSLSISDKDDLDDLLILNDMPNLESLMIELPNYNFLTNNEMETFKSNFSFDVMFYGKAN